MNQNSRELRLEYEAALEEAIHLFIRIMGYYPVETSPIGRDFWNRFDIQALCTLTEFYFRLETSKC